MAAASAGKRMAARIEMMAMTTSNSISVKACAFEFLGFIQFNFNLFTALIKLERIGGVAWFGCGNCLKCAQA